MLPWTHGACKRDLNAFQKIQKMKQLTLQTGWVSWSVFTHFKKKGLGYGIYLLWPNGCKKIPCSYEVVLWSAYTPTWPWRNCLHPPLTPQQSSILSGNLEDRNFQIFQQHITTFNKNTLMASKYIVLGSPPYKQYQDMPGITPRSWSWSSSWQWATEPRCAATIKGVSWR